MAIFPGELIPWIMLQFCDDDGNPVNGGQLFCYIAGTTTKQDTFSEASLAEISANPNPIVMDANGRPPDPIFLSPTGYQFMFAPADDTDPPSNPFWTIDDVENVGAVFAANFGLVMNEGSVEVNSGYIQLTTDRTVTTDGADATDPFIFNLLPAAEATTDLTIVHFGTGDLAVTPDGSDTINTVAAAYTVTAGTSPNFPAITLRPDGVSGWLVVSRAN